MSGVGYVGVLLAVLGFGSNYLPLKRIDVGDGMFFQFIMCTAIFMTGIPVLAMQDWPKIDGLALFGGFLWCTGNALCPVVIRLIGMGMGLLIWGSSSMVMGWASGTYGLFGLNRNEVSNAGLNISGLCVAMIGLLIFLQVKSDGSKKKEYVNMIDEEDPDDRHTSLLPGSPISHMDSNPMKKSHDQLVDEADEETWMDNLTDSQRRTLGLVLALCAGVFFGTSFNPSQWIIDNRHDGDDEPMNYVFAHYTGVLLTSWAYFIIYLIYKQYYVNDKPMIDWRVVLPATLSGIIWSIGEIGWFFANGKLGFTVTFPIVSCGPGFVGSIYGILLYSEITGKRNFMFLGIAAVVSVVGLVMVALAH